MLLTPRYDGPVVLEFEGSDDDLSVPLLRQRRRLAQLLAEFDEAQWSAPSRCDEWTVRDVIAHLVGTNQFWAVSMAKGLAGEPTRFLATFDPVSTPAQMVDAVQTWTSSEVLERFVTTTAALADSVADVDAAAWSTLAEAPPGHVSLRGVAMHALWDSWIHERDVLLPLGIEPVEEADEVRACLRYAAAIGPALLAAAGSTRSGTLAVHATDPDMDFIVAVGPTVVVRDAPPAGDTACLAGRAVDLVEALTFRAPLRAAIEPEHRWMLAGLGEVFDVAG